MDVYKESVSIFTYSIVFLFTFQSIYYSLKLLKWSDAGLDVFCLNRYLIIHDLNVFAAGSIFTSDIYTGKTFHKTLSVRHNVTSLVCNLLCGDIVTND